MTWGNSPVVLSTDAGGRHFAKEIILSWLVGAGGSNLKLLETATGLPQKLLSSLLAEMVEERIIKLDKVVFKPLAG